MNGHSFSREEREDRLNRAALYRRMAQSMPDEVMAERFFRLAQALQEMPSAPIAQAASMPAVSSLSRGSGWQALREGLNKEAERRNAADPVRCVLSLCNVASGDRKSEGKG